MLARTALTGLVVTAALAILPAFASAAIAPTLAINQSAGTTAGSSPATGFDINTNSDLDAAKTLTISFPAGFLLNLQTDGGACLGSAAINPACQLGSGMINGASGTPVALYLVAPPNLSDVAGVVLSIGGSATNTATGEVTLAGSAPNIGLNLVFNNLPPALAGGALSPSEIKELQFTLAGPRLPTSCGGAHTVTVAATSQLGGSGSTSAPLAVTGCGALPYAPTVAATVTKEQGTSGALVAVTVTQGAGESATSSIGLGSPTGVKINKVLAPCFQGATCTVGTVSGISPLLSSAAFSAGMLTLTGSVNTGAFTMPITGSVTMSFPPPYQFSATGPINTTEHTISFFGIPDIPMSTLTFTFTGTPAGPAFTTACEAGPITASFVPQDGNPPVKATGPVTNVNCSKVSSGAKATASGSLSGLASGKPTLKLRASHASGGPGIASLSIGLPAGLSFNRKVLVRRRTCNGKGKRRKCTTSVSARGMSMSGAGLKSARIQGGGLLLTFARAAGRVSLLARGPLLVESKALRRRARQHRVAKLSARLRITEAGGSSTNVSVP
jgi:hypothetical protein